MTEQFTGDVEVLNSASSNVTIHLDGEEGNIRLGGGGKDGDVVLYRSSVSDSEVSSFGNATIHLNGEQGNVRLGGDGRDGDLVLYSSSATASETGNFGNATIHLNGEEGNIRLGGGGKDGDVALYRGSASSSDVGSHSNATIHLNGEQGNIRLGGDGRDGDLVLYSASATSSDVGSFSNATIHLNGEEGNVRLGGDGKDGDLVLYASSASAADLGSFSNATIHLNGNTGDIILRNADAAEDFDVQDESEATPGTVMVIHEDGRLRKSEMAYDRKVAGIVSGSGDLKPGLILDRNASDGHRVPIALMGKVNCKVDARFGAIEVGDLLTSSPTPGHAMKADDPFKAFGAVIGKALKPIQQNRGVIPILIALQ